MARSVKDAAILFSAMVGSDPADPATADAGKYRKDYAAGLSAGGLKGVRIAVYRPDMPALETVRFEEALAVLKAQGAVLVDVTRPKTDGMGDAEFDVLKFELKSDLDKYLAATPPRGEDAHARRRSIAFDTANAATEMPYFAQEIFDMAAKSKGVGRADLRGAARRSRWPRAKGAIDTMLADAGATILVQPTYGPAWLSDPVYGDQYNGPSSSELPAISGYPNLTVPMGLVRGLPVGLSFIGPAYSEQALLNAGYAYEQASKARAAPRYLPTVDAGPEVDGGAVRAGSAARTPPATASAAARRRVPSRSRRCAPCSAGRPTSSDTTRASPPHTTIAPSRRKRGPLVSIAGHAAGEAEAEREEDPRNVAEMAVEIGRDDRRMAEEDGPVQDALPADRQRHEARDRDDDLEQAFFDHGCSSNSARMWTARSDIRTSTMNATSEAIRNTIARMKASATSVPILRSASSATNSNATTRHVITALDTARNSAALMIEMRRSSSRSSQTWRSCSGPVERGCSASSARARSTTRDSRPASTLSSPEMPASMNTGDSESWIVWAIVETVASCIAAHDGGCRAGKR